MAEKEMRKAERMAKAKNLSAAYKLGTFRLSP